MALSLVAGPVLQVNEITEAENEIDGHSAVGQAGTTTFTDTAAPPAAMRHFYKVERISP